jgi:hypothetical protein
MKEVNKRIVWGKKYALAFDKEYEEKILKSYKSNDSINGIERIINEKDSNGDRLINSYYQINKSDKCKLFMDFDKLHIENNEECDILINNVIDSINEVYNVNITISDLVIDYYWDTRKDKLSNGREKEINSIHIICKSFYTDRILMKRFSHYFYNKYDIEIDDIYCVNDNKTRCFRMRDMWKLQATENEKLISYKSNDNHTFKEMWIDYIEDLEYVDMKEEYKEEVIQISSVVEKTIRKNSNVVSIDLIDTELCRKIMSDFHKEFYDSKDWNKLYHLIKKLIITDTNTLKEDFILEFLSISADNSSKYSLEENIKYHKENEIPNYLKYSGIKLFLKICNKYLDYQLVKDYTDKNIINESNVWIEKITGISKNTIYNLMSKWDKDNDNDFIDINDNWKYDMKNCLLMNYDTKIIHNFNEVLYERYMLDNEEFIDFDYVINNNDKYDRKETPKQMIELRDMFINQKINDIYGKSKWGTGKSFKLMKPIIRSMYLTNKKLSVLIITDNNTLNTELYEDLKDIGFVSHLSNKKDFMDCNRIICSCESLRKIDKNDFDICIMDELETLMGQYESETISDNYKSDIKNAVDTIRLQIRNTKQLICLDADLSIDRMNIIKQLRMNKTSKSYYYTLNPYLDYTFNHYVYDNKLWNGNWEKDIIEDNKNIVFSFTSKTIGDEYKRTIEKLCEESKVERNILYVNGMGAFLTNTTKLMNSKNEIVCESLRDKQYIYNGETIDYKNNSVMKKHILEDIDKFVVENNINVLMYSPTFKTGINIKTKYFHKHYSYGKSGSVNVRTYLQMLFRVRELIDEEFNVYIGGNIGYCKKHISYTRMGEYLSNVAIIHKKEYHMDGRFSITENDKKHFKKDNSDKNYFDWRVINRTENYNSDIMFSQLFIEKLKINHKLNHKYIWDFNECDSEVHNIIKDMKKLIHKERLEMLKNTDKIDIGKFKHIKELIQKKKHNDNITISQEEYNEYNKFKLLIGFYYTDEENKYTNEYYIKELEKMIMLEKLLSSGRQSYIWDWLDNCNNYLEDNDDIELVNKMESIVRIIGSNYMGDIDYENDMFDDMDYEVDLYEYVVNGKEVRNMKNWRNVGNMCYLYKHNETGECRIFYYKCNIEKGLYNKELSDILKDRLIEEENKYQFINNEMYYDKWTKNEKRNIHRRILNIINPYEKKQELVGYMLEDNDNESVCSNDTNESLETDYKKKQMEHIYNHYIIELMKVFGISLEEDNIVMSNANWWITIHNNFEKIKLLENEYNEYLTISKYDRIGNNDITKHNINYNDDKKTLNNVIKENKQFRTNIKNINNILNNHLHNINKEIVYMDKNTFNTGGKICIRTKPNYRFNHNNNQNKLNCINVNDKVVVLVDYDKEDNEVFINEYDNTLLINPKDIHTNKKTGKKTKDRKTIYEYNKKYYNRKINNNKVKKMLKNVITEEDKYIGIGDIVMVSKDSLENKVFDKYNPYINKTNEREIDNDNMNVDSIVDRVSVMELSEIKRKVRVDRINFHKEQKDCIDKLSNDMNCDIMSVGCIVDRVSVMELSEIKRKERVDRINREQKDYIDKLSNDMNWDIMNVGCI